MFLTPQNSPNLKQLPVGSPRQNLELNLSLLLSKAWGITAQSNKSHEEQAGSVNDNKSRTAGPVRASQPLSETAQCLCGLTQRGQRLLLAQVWGNFLQNQRI